MKKAPQNIIATFEMVKSKERGYIALKSIKNGYYVYRQSSRWDREHKRAKPLTEYLGKITKDGIFVRKALSAKDDLENAKSIIAAHGGEIIWHEKPEETAEVKETTVMELTPDEIDSKLLTILSMNARADLAYWGRKLNLSEQATYYRVKRLEERLGIRYITEINVEKLGYLKFIGFVKFLGAIPSVEEIRSAFEDEGRVQLALLTSGKYDLILFFYAKTNTEVIDFLYYTRRKNDAPLIKYNAKWHIAPYYDDYGFLPVRDKFLDIIEKEVKERKFGGIAQRDIVVLKDLNSNAGKSFTQIDKDNKLNRGSADYSYYKLKRDGLIIRTTISITKLPIKFVGVILLEITGGAKFTNIGRPALIREIIRTDKIANTYALVGDIEVPDGVVLFSPIFTEEDLDNVKNYISSKVAGVTMKVIMVQNTIIGSLCYRRFDNVSAPQYDFLVNQYKLLPPKEKVDYEETARRSRVNK